jgi:tetratricopeptide (TPR) repeat protein
MTLTRVVFAVAVLIAAAPTATAEQVAAKAHYQQGLKFYNLSRYKEALAEFEAAYLIKPDPMLLFNIGQCQRQLAEYAAAERSYRAFLREAGDAATPQLREQTQKLMQEMERAQTEARAKQPPTGTAPPTESERRPLAVPPDPVSPRTAAPPRPADAKPWHSRPMAIGGFASLGVGIALVAVGGALVGKSISLRDEATRSMFLGEQEQLRGDALTYERSGYALLGVGTAAAVTGAVLTGVAASRRNTPSIALSPTCGGVSVFVGGALW